MYGSSFITVTFNPLLSKREPSEAERIPLPIEETTPPVTNKNLGLFEAIFFIQDGLLVYQNSLKLFRKLYQK